MEEAMSQPDVAASKAVLSTDTTDSRMAMSTKFSPHLSAFVYSANLPPLVDVCMQPVQAAKRQQGAGICKRMHGPRGPLQGVKFTCQLSVS